MSLFVMFKSSIHRPVFSAGWLWFFFSGDSRPLTMDQPTEQITGQLTRRTDLRRNYEPKGSIQVLGPHKSFISKIFQTIDLKTAAFCQLSRYLLVFSKSNQQWGRGGGFIKVALMQGQGPIIKETTR